MPDAVWFRELEHWRRLEVRVCRYAQLELILWAVRLTVRVLTGLSKWAEESRRLSHRLWRRCERSGVRRSIFKRQPGQIHSFKLLFLRISRPSAHRDPKLGTMRSSNGCSDGVRNDICVQTSISGAPRRVSSRIRDFCISIRKRKKEVL